MLAEFYSRLLVFAVTLVAMVGVVTFELNRMLIAVSVAIPAR